MYVFSRKPCSAMVNLFASQATMKHPFFFSVKPSSSSENDEVSTLSREQELARQRRLEMFANLKSTTNSSSD